MALGEYGPRAAYFAVADGAIIRRFKDETGDPEAKPVTRKDGSIVYERQFKYIEGFVTKIEIASSTFNGVTTEKAQWKIHVKDGDENYVVTMHYNSAYAKRFINCAASVTDWSKRIRISPWKMDKTDDKGMIMPGKFWLGVTLYAAPYGKDNKYAPKYSKDDIPPMVKVRFKGEDRWDDEAQMLFWEKVVTDEIIPKIQAVSALTTFSASADPHAEHELAIETATAGGAQNFDDNDVPF